MITEISQETIENKLSEAIKYSAYHLEKSAEQSLFTAGDIETADMAKKALDIMIKNVEIADESHIPLCQDTGMLIAFVEIGNDVHVIGDIKDAINNAVKTAYRDLRKSIVDPILRINTKTNTPAVIHFDIVNGNNLKIKYMLKGFGSENMSALAMLEPYKGIEGIKKFVVNAVKEAGASPCPPIIVGVGIGGSAEKATLLSKEALFRKIGERSKKEHIATLEKNILQEINQLRIGAQGYGGDITAYDVFIEDYPTHIASIPVAVNICCHASRHGEVII